MAVLAVNGKSPGQSAFERDWAEVRNRVNRGSIQSSKSPVWKELIEDFRQDAAEGAGSLFGLNQFRSYGFLRPTRYERALMALQQGALQLSFLAGTAFRRMSAWLWDFHLNKIALHHLMTYPRYERALQELGLWREYQTFCKTLDVSPVSFNTAKLFYVSSQIQGILGNSQEPARVLEIGAGTGDLAVMLMKRYPVSCYLIVDLPEMALCSALTLRHFFPDLPIRFFGVGDPDVLRWDRGVVYVFPDGVAHIPDGISRISLNIDSFQEMTAEQVQGYLALMQRATSEGGHLITLNRRRQIGEFDNNPLLYPYGRKNEVLRWEADPFMTYALNILGAKDLHMLRIERVCR